MERKDTRHNKVDLVLLTLMIIVWLFLFGNSGIAHAETFEGREGYWQWVEATAYWVNDPVDASGTGIAADGKPAIPYYTLAVDPDCIPWHRDIYVPGIGWMYSHDTGGAIQGAIVDIGMDSREAAFKWGRRTVKIFVAAKT